MTRSRQESSPPALHERSSQTLIPASCLSSPSTAASTTLSSVVRCSEEGRSKYFTGFSELYPRVWETRRESRCSSQVPPRLREVRTCLSSPSSQSLAKLKEKAEVVGS